MSTKQGLPGRMLVTMRKIAAWCLALFLATVLAACSVYETHQAREAAARAEEATNAYPANYKSDVLAMLRVYVNDPANVRDAGVSEPFLQMVGGRNRYAVCVRFGARRGGEQSSAIKSHIAYFATGRLDQMIEANRNQCDAAAYQPFPEAEKLSR